MKNIKSSLIFKNNKTINNQFKLIYSNPKLSHFNNQTNKFFNKSRLMTSKII